MDHPRRYGLVRRRHGPNSYVWNVPPAAAAIALEQLCEAKHARPATSHVFIVPTVLMPMWRKCLGKIADVVFNLKAGLEFWPSACHEPLTIALVCPLLSSRPWQVKYCKTTQREVSRVLHGVWTATGTAQRDYLRQLWAHAWDRADV